MRIRWAMRADAHALTAVFFTAVRFGPGPYTPAQRAAWTPHPPATEDFAARLCPMRVIAAETQGMLVGFMAMDDTGYIDLVFILPDHRGRRLFRTFHEALEKEARARGLARMTTHASLMAEPAFRAVGFSVIQHETVTYAGEDLPRAEMEKRLT